MEPLGLRFGSLCFRFLQAFEWRDVGARLHICWALMGARARGDGLLQGSGHKGC